MKDIIGKTTAKKERLKGAGSILVVEDNKINLSLITSILERTGCAVHTEETGEGGVKASLEKKFDLVLMDIQLPDISGLEAMMKRIRDGSGPKVPVIALTALRCFYNPGVMRSLRRTLLLSLPVVLQNNIPARSLCPGQLLFQIPPWNVQTRQWFLSLTVCKSPL